MQLDEIVPWGRSYEEYLRMFALSAPDLRGSILDCGGGPSSFNAKLTCAGRKVISCDPIYEFSADQIAGRIKAVSQKIIDGAKADRERYIWTDIRSPEEMAQRRWAAMSSFLEDYPAGRQQGRYLVETLPALSFADAQFDLALCSHLLFTYSAHLSAEFHLQSIRELCRVAREARIFPLLDMSGDRSPHLEPVVAALKEQQFSAELCAVPYEFQKGGNQMLRVRPPQQR